MKLMIVVLLVALALGGLVGALVLRDPGYVLVSYGGMALETSLWFALLALLVTYLATRLVLRLIVRIGRGGASLRSWRSERRDRNARLQTLRGLQLMAEGHWRDARKRLEAAAPHVEVPLVNYLQAASAAHHLGDAAGRDELFEAARASADDAGLAVALTHARLLFADRQWQACLAALGPARRQDPANAELLGMQVRCYRQLQDWQAVIELLPEIEKYHALTDSELTELRRHAWLQRLGDPRVDALAMSADLPKSLRRDAELVQTVARAALAAGRGDEAEPLLRHALEQEWSEGLVRAYGLLAPAAAQHQLSHAEGWLKKHPNDAELLLALGRICLGQQRWARAREYLEASLKLSPDSAVQGELGRLCLAMGEAERGAELAVQALRELPDLPLPGRGA
jgi:HemY protein